MRHDASGGEGMEVPSWRVLQVVVRGGDFRNGVDYKCRFGSSVVAATFHADPQQFGNQMVNNVISCVSPPSAEQQGPMRLMVSLNGVDFVPHYLNFVYI